MTRLKVFRLCRFRMVWFLARIVLTCMLLCWITMQAIFSPAVITHAFRTFGETPRIYIQPDVRTALIEPDACSAAIFLVIVVCSALENQAERQAIRETWGSITKKQPDVRLVFLVGKHNTSEMQERVEEESRNYSDVIQEDFIDTYNNLTLKSIFMLKWTSRSCAQAKFVLKTDDDMFINVPNLLQYLRTRGSSRTMLGSLIVGAKPVRDEDSKWFESESYVDDSYPEYLSGTAYVISGDLLRDLFGVAVDTSLSRLEDVFLTGICAERVNLVLKHSSCFHYSDFDFNPCRARRIYSAHRQTPSQLYDMWKELQNSNLSCENIISKYVLDLMQPYYC